MCAGSLPSCSRSPSIQRSETTPHTGWSAPSLKICQARPPGTRRHTTSGRIPSLPCSRLAGALCPHTPAIVVLFPHHLALIIMRGEVRTRARDDPAGLLSAEVHQPLWRNGLHQQDVPRSEEHTSELQSRLHLVCRL